MTETSSLLNWANQGLRGLCAATILLSAGMLHAAGLDGFGSITDQPGVQRPGKMVWMDLLTGDVRVADPPTVALATVATVSIDAASRELRVVDPGGRKVVVRSPETD